MLESTRHTDTTLRDQDDVERVTIREGADFDPVNPRSAGFSPPESPRVFRGWIILEQLPTRGAEADIYIVSARTALENRENRRVLKLYRHRLEPKIEVLNRITEISRQNSHCFVVFLETGFDEETGRWYELQEYMPLGSLRDIPAETKRLPGFAENLVPELMNAIRCLHENGIVHCDIKPANVLVRSLEPLDLVLTDFGISSLLASDMSQRMTSLKGTPMYWAPEAFSRVIGRQCDWWGLGMIVLEILAGEHPLEGMTDSQIIHKLTLGNIEVPDSIGPDWGLLVKGLLTKDDSLRWGGNEISLWLSGKRNIPVHYEEPGSPERSGGQKPFIFETADCRTTEEVARAFAASEKPWLAPSDYLRFVRQWFERNMLFDDALELGRAIGEAQPEQALFRFVHEAAKLPFSIMGHVVDVNNLRLFLWRYIHREASEGEERIVQMLGDGALSSYYDEYAPLSGGRDAFLAGIMRFMIGKDAGAQWKYLDAMLNPGEYLWPDDASTASADERLSSLAVMRSAPPRRDDMERTLAAHALPGGLLKSLRSVSSCAEGMTTLDRLKTAGLFFPRGDSGALYENMSADEYERAARQHYLGHTQAVLGRLGSLCESLRALPPPQDYSPALMLFDTIERVESLSERKITPWDSLFIANASDLFGERARIESRQMTKFIGGGLGGGALFFLIRLISGGNSILFFFMALFLTFIAGGIFYLAFAEGAYDGRRNRFESAISTLLFLLIFISFQTGSRVFILHREFMFPLLTGLTFLTGATWGCAIGYGLNRYALSKNRNAILSTCEEYLKHIEEDEGGNEE
jgi:tRNA A-37 threonylcarbamoyl transferase component Bud32